MTLQGRRSNICNEDRATLESDPSALQGHRQTAAPVFPECPNCRQWHLLDGSCGFCGFTNFTAVKTPGGGSFYVSNWNRCLAPKANTPGHGVAEPFPL